MTEIQSLSSMCRCCHRYGQFKSLLQPYKYQNQVEIYSHLLEITFNIIFQSNPLKEVSSSICEECIVRVRDAAHFKRQVLECEQKYLEYCKNELECVAIKEEQLSDDVHDSVAPSPLHYEEDLSFVKVEFSEDDSINQEDSNTSTNNYSSENANERQKAESTTVEKKKIKCDKKKLTKSPETSKDVDSNTKARIKREKSTRDKKLSDKKKKYIKTVREKFKEISELIYCADRKYFCRKCDSKQPNMTAIYNHIQSEHDRELHQLFFTKNGETISCKSCNKIVEEPVHSCKKNRNKICEKCNKIIHGTGADFSKHQSLEHNENPNKCSFCNKTFMSKSYLAEHENSHTRKQQFICDLCNKAFAYKLTLRRHLEWHNGTHKKAVCDQCGLAFNDYTNMNAHKEAVHLKLRKFACDQCPKTFTAKKHLKNHMFVHTGEKFTCDICYESFDTVHRFYSHKSTHNIPKKGLECSDCGKIFFDRNIFRKHIKTHMLATSLVHKCHLCPKSFASKYVLKRHIEYHNGIKKYSCDICFNKFSTKDVMLKHKKTVHDPNRTIIGKEKCEICKRNVTNLEAHIEQHANRPLKCPMCPNTFNKGNALNRHVKTKHLDVSFLSCDLCGKKYRGEHCLKKHKSRVHKVSCKTENFDSVVPAFEITVT